MAKTEDEILKEAHDYSAALDQREERREIYQRVAIASIYTVDDDSDMYWKPENTARIAEAIYQGMLKFVGDKT